MNRSKRVFVVSTIVLSTMIFVNACGDVSQEKNSSVTRTVTSTSTSTLTVFSTLTPTFFTPKNTATPAPTSSVILSFAPSDVSMAYALDGNLYFQDGNKPPLQLTHHEEYRHPIGFSENGEKIFFFKGNTNDLFSIRVDGSNEQPLVTNDLLKSTIAEYDETTTFCEPVLVPKSSLILFRTCSHPDGYTTIYQDDLFVVDFETNQARVLLPKGKGGGYYYPSPDGSMLAIGRAGYVEVLSVNGRKIHSKLATFPISEPWALAPLVFWTSDSQNLVLALPINTFFDSSPPPMYEVWRYSVESGVGIQINLDPLPSGHDPVWASPDGNWILYRNEEERPFYLVNLNNVDPQSYEPNDWNIPCAWSPDNIHFVYESVDGLYIGSLNGPPDFLERGDCVGWLDANRFIYYSLDKHAYSIKEINRTPILILTGDNTLELRSYNSIIFYPPVTR